MTDTLALVAPGAMGAGLGARLVTRGAQVLTVTEGRSAASQARAEAAGMQAVAPSALMQAGWFLSVVPPAEALALANAFARWCEGVATPPVYVDLNAVNPDTVREVQAVIEAAGARFVDGCIVGFPPKGDEVGPTVYVSEDAAALAALLNAHGVVAQTLAGGVGAASALKMAYAGLSKGVAALGVAMVLAAERHGAGQALRAALAETRPGLRRCWIAACRICCPRPGAGRLRWNRSPTSSVATARKQRSTPRWRRSIGPWPQTSPGTAMKPRCCARSWNWIGPSAYSNAHTSCRIAHSEQAQIAVRR